MSDYINTLNDECLYYIFNLVPLYVYVPKYIYVPKHLDTASSKAVPESEDSSSSDDSSSSEEIQILNPRTPVSQLHLDQVCKRWSRLLPLACAQRTTLAVTLNGLPIRGNCDDDRDFDPSPRAVSSVCFNQYRKAIYTASAQESNATLVLPYLLPRYKDYRTADERADQSEWLEPSQTFLATLHDSTEEYFTERARYKHARHDRQLAPYLVGTFPKVRTLVVTHQQCMEGELGPLVDLVCAWPALRSVKLWIRTWEIDEAYHTEQHPVATQLLPCLNQLAPLQQLILLITGQVNYSLITGQVVNTHTFPVDLFTFVSKHNVVKLNMGTYDNDDFAWDLVHRFRDTKWHLIDTANTKVDNLSEALNPQFEFANKQAHLFRLKLFFVNAPQFGQFSRKFSDSLSRLRLIWKRNITYTQLVTSLVVLKQLSILELTIKFDEHPPNPFVLEDGDDCDPEVRLSLPQVKTLKFDIDKQSHDDFESFSALIFPSVEMIIVANSDIDIFWPCLDCLPNRREFFDQGHNWRALREMTSRCRSLLRASLKAKFGKEFWDEASRNEDWISKLRAASYQRRCMIEYG